MFNSIVFGVFTGFLVDFWLGRAAVKDPVRLIAAIVTGVIVGALVFVGRVAYF